MTDKREPIFWSVGDNEQLYHETRDEAVGAYLDDFVDEDDFVDGVDLPQTVLVKGHARMIVDASLCRSMLDDLLEHLDEEYGDPDGDPTEATSAMIEAEKVFIKAVLDEYESWACEPVCTEVVKVAEWVEKNRPDW